jgi:hypothetical protein
MLLVMELEETEARNSCAGESQQQFDRPRINILVMDLEETETQNPE